MDVPWRSVGYEIGDRRSVGVTKQRTTGEEVALKYEYTRYGFLYVFEKYSP